MFNRYKKYFEILIIFDIFSILFYDLHSLSFIFQIQIWQFYYNLDILKTFEKSLSHRSYAYHC